MSWEHIRGHAAPLESFRAAVACGRLGQAYLFVGPDGIGKRLFARELAKVLLCERSPALLTACDHCPACSQIEAGTHPDVFTTRKPDDRHQFLIDDMRAFCSLMAMKPSRGNRKIGILDDADDFSKESANCFLKTLEEPPRGSVLILLATNIDRQLPTILSRCQLVRFAPLIESDLRWILAEKGVEDPVQRNRLAHLAGGSASQALALNNAAFDEVRRKLILGVTSPRPNFADLAQTWQHFYEDAGKDTSGHRLRAALVLRFLLEALQQALRLSLGADTPDLDPEEQTHLRDFAERLGTDQLVTLIDRCLEADYHIERRVQLILVIESVLQNFIRPAA